MALNASTADCMNQIMVTAPNCDCPDIPAPMAEGPTSQSICQGENIFPFMAFSTTAGYVIDWYDAPTGGNLLAGNTTVFQATMSGTYYAEVRDPASGCTSATRLAFTLVINPTPTVTISADATNICMGESTLITAIAQGGVPPYSYFWDNGLPPQASITVSPSSTTTFCVTVTDANGCTSEECITITVNPAINISLNITNESMPGASDGAIMSTVNGGTTPYMYSWSNGVNAPQITGLSPGTYCLTVTDAMGCTAEECGNIQPANCPDFLIDADGLFEICPGSMDGLINITNVSGGATPYTFSWSTGASGASIGQLGTGTYTVTITDANGCIATRDFEIIASDNEAPVFDNCTDIYTITDCNIITFDTPTASDNCGLVTVVQTEGPASGDAFPDGVSTITFTATDQSGNTSSCSYEVFINLISEIGVETSPEHDMDMDGSAIITFTGGVAPFSYTWTDTLGMVISTDQDLTHVSAGTYTVTVEDANGCTATLTVEIDHIVATRQLLLDANISIAPNPASDQLYISIDGTNLDEVTYELYNLQGELITHIINESNKMQMDVAQYPKALYLLRISIRGKSIIRKIILE